MVDWCWVTAGVLESRFGKSAIPSRCTCRRSSNAHVSINDERGWGTRAVVVVWVERGEGGRAETYRDIEREKETKRHCQR